MLRKSCFWLVSAWLLSAIVAYAFAEGKTQELYGAALPASCKTPCSDFFFLEWPGCVVTNVEMGTCDLTRCYQVKVALTKCTTTANAPSGAVACETKETDEYWRWITVRTEPCTNGGNFTDDYGDECTISSGTAVDKAGNPRYNTPCKTSACSTGPIQGNVDQPVDSKKRTRCKN